jgi:hypothetical protein
MNPALLMRVITAALFLGLVVSAKAGLIPMSPELKAFLMRPDQTQAVIGAMGQQWRTIFENCALPKLQGMNVLIVVPPTLDSSGTPVSGEWRMVGRMEGCGETRILSVEYLFAPDGQMKRLALLPGTTVANLRLQRDALMYAVTGMMKLSPKDCKDIKGIDTKFVGLEDTGPSTGAGGRPWKEEWTMRACGVTGVVTMHFAPDPTGTSIRAALNETRLVNP